MIRGFGIRRCRAAGSTAEPRRNRGFTLLELMTAVAVVGVLAALSVPMFTSFTRNQRVKAATSDLVFALLEARGEALKRNAEVVVSPSDDGWSFGWTVTTSGAALDLLNHQTPTFDDGGSSTSYLDITGPDTVNYNGTGRLNASVTSFRIASAVGSSSSVRPRCVVIDLSGMPRSAVSDENGDCP